MTLTVKILGDRKPETIKTRNETEITHIKGQCGDDTGVINYRVTKENALLL